MRQFRARYRARQLTLDLVRCLARRDRFQISLRRIIIGRHVKLMVMPGRTYRCFDRIIVDYKGVEVWLPLLSRLRLRQVVRCVLAEAAQEGIYGDQR